MVIAVAAQVYPAFHSDTERDETNAANAVNLAVVLIRSAEAKLKEFYEQPKTLAPEARTEPPVSAPLQPRPSRKVIEESITAASQVLIAKKLKSQDELVGMLGAYGVKNKSQLNDEQAIELMNKLKEILK